MQLLRSLVFYVFYLGWTAAVAVAGLFLLPLPKRFMLGLGRVWCRGIVRLLSNIAKIDYEVRGQIPDAPVIVASKHQSSWETLIFPILLFDPAYVLKKELTFIPLLGTCFKKAGHIAVDRGAGGKALRSMIRDAETVKAERRSIIIFPEGTRSPPGQSLPYHPGVQALYSHLDLPVVPVALNSGLFWPRRSILKRPGRIVIEFMEPIPPNQDRKALLATLRERIENRTRSLEAEAARI